MPYVYVGTDVLEEFDDDDLIDELKSRGMSVRSVADQTFEVNETIRKIYEKRRIGEDYQRELEALIYDVLGRVV